MKSAPLTHLRNKKSWFHNILSRGISRGIFSGFLSRKSRGIFAGFSKIPGFLSRKSRTGFLKIPNIFVPENPERRDIPNIFIPKIPNGGISRIFLSRKSRTPGYPEYFYPENPERRDIPNIFIPAITKWGIFRRDIPNRDIFYNPGQKWPKTTK